MKNKIIFVISVLFALCLVGCSTLETPIVEINHEAEACGLKDPYNNLPCIPTILKQVSGWDENGYMVSIHRDTVSNEDVIVLYFIRYVYGCIAVYNCSGEELVAGNYYSCYQPAESDNKCLIKNPQANMYNVTPPPPCDECDSVLNRTIFKELIYFQYYNCQ